MLRLMLLLILIAAAGPAAETVSVFPRVSWFRQHFAAPRTRVDLERPRRLAEYLATGEIDLTLHAYLELVLANNTDIALTRLSVEISANAISRALGAYDPKFSAGFSSMSMTQTSINSLEGKATVRTSHQPFSASYSQLLPSGGSLSVQFYARRSTTNQVFSTYNPILSTGLTLGFEQPLLRNRDGSLTRKSILAARSALRISRYQFADQVTTLVANAENTYWSVVQARENLMRAKKFLELRAAALERAQKQVDAGALLPLEMYQSRSDYASAQVSVLQATRILAQQENALRQQIGADLDPAIRGLPISLTEPLEIPIIAPPDKEEAVRAALKARPDVLAAAAALDMDDISIRRAAETLRPDVSVTGSYTSQGIGGTYLPASLPGGLGDAIGQMFRFGFPVYQMGVTMTLPIRDRVAAADVADALIKKRQDALALRKQQQTLRRQVLDAVDALETARATLEQARLACEFAGKRFAAEQKKYELGTTQLFFLLEAQTSLNSAENAVLEESINYRRNIINLNQLTGRLLDQRGIAVE
jgi:outer membrane protein